MEKPKPQRFTQQTLLKTIVVKHLAQFFEHFTHVLAGRNLPLPTCLAGTGGYYDAWVELLKKPETLPEPLVEAVLTIEELAAPENRPLLEEKLREARVANPWLDPKDSPECLALQLWLLSPYGSSSSSSSNPIPNSSPPRPSAGPPRPSDGRGVRGEGDTGSVPS